MVTAGAWLLLIVMVLISALWVRVRRQRKARENTYVPN
jgi:hypothetical protein